MKHLETDMRYIVVIGAMNVDVAGLSGPGFQMHDSTPGAIRLSTGGVGQNIARNLVKLGICTYLISVCGDDSFGKIALSDCRSAGLQMDLTTVIPGGTTSTYLYVNDSQGDLVAAVNDMNILEQLTPERLNPMLDFINAAAFCVIDANLPEETLQWIGTHVTAPICADTTSAAKCRKLSAILNNLFILKANELEAAVMAGQGTDSTGREMSDEAVAPAADLPPETASSILGGKTTGANHVFISMGAKGMLYHSEEAGETGIVPVMECRITSTNGAGDCAMAAILRTFFKYGENASDHDAACASQAAASINLESPYSFAPELTEENLEKRIAEYRERRSTPL